MKCYQCGGFGHMARDCKTGLVVLMQRRRKRAATIAERKDISPASALKVAIATTTPRTIPRASATVAMKSAILPANVLVFHPRLRQLK